jgi:acyl carrier protein
MEEKLLGIVSKIIKVPPENLSLETSRQEVESWDSFAQLYLISEIEETFNAVIPIEEITKIHKISDFMKYLKE